MNELKLVKIKTEYCDYLRQFDEKVPYNFNRKVDRPFVGILFQVESCKYFAPLSSPKPKHLSLRNTLDFFKIKNGELGAINFNNMIPVRDDVVEPFNIHEYDVKYCTLLQGQIFWLNRHKEQIYFKSQKLYHKYISHTLPENVARRCCDFPLLETKCKDYVK